MTDRNLMRGIFRKKLKDFSEDYKERLNGMTLYERLTKNIFEIETGVEDDSKPSVWK
jgi:hypothetical protein